MSTSESETKPPSKKRWKTFLKRRFPILKVSQMAWLWKIGKKQQPTQLRSLNVYFLAIYFTRGKRHNLINWYSERYLNNCNNVIIWLVWWNWPNKFDMCTYNSLECQVNVISTVHSIWYILPNVKPIPIHFLNLLRHC